MVMNSIEILNVRIDNLTCECLLKRLNKGVLVTANFDDIVKV